MAHWGNKKRLQWKLLKTASFLGTLSNHESDGDENVTKQKALMSEQWLRACVRYFGTFLRSLKTSYTIWKDREVAKNNVNLLFRNRFPWPRLCGSSKSCFLSLTKEGKTTLLQSSTSFFLVIVHTVMVHTVMERSWNFEFALKAGKVMDSQNCF